MNLIIVKNPNEIAKLVSQLIISYIEKNPKIVFGLATGSTPLETYRLLVNNYQTEKTNWAHVKTFNLDEYVGLDPENEQSYHYYMNDNFFNHINIKKENTFLPKGIGNLQKNAQDYEALIKKHGPIDLQILGIGTNGHIGFNEPGSDIKSVTRVVKLSEKTIAANHHYFEDEYQVPIKAITMGISTILAAKNIVLIASGKEKAEAINALFHHQVSSDWPCTYLQTHKQVTVIIDEAAASLLQKTKEVK